MNTEDQRRSGRLGGIESARRMTDEARRDRARRAHLAGAVATVVRRSADLDEAAREAIANAVRPTR
jgi:hypothetical protein